MMQHEAILICEDPLALSVQFSSNILALAQFSSTFFFVILLIDLNFASVELHRN